MRTIVVLLFMLHVNVAISQDIIKCHTGKEMNVEVSEVGENSIFFRYPGEGVSQSIGKAAVSQIRFKSGRIQEVTEKVSVAGKDGWEHVTITTNPNDIIGLKRVGEIKAKAGGYWSMRTTKGSDRKATERIKRETAEKGGHVIFIQQHETSGRGFYKNPESIQSGVAYGY